MPANDDDDHHRHRDHATITTLTATTTIMATAATETEGDTTGMTRKAQCTTTPALQLPECVSLVEIKKIKIDQPKTPQIPPTGTDLVLRIERVADLLGRLEQALHILPQSKALL